MDQKNIEQVVITTQNRPNIVSSDYLSTFLQFMRTVESEYNYYKDEVEKYQNSTQDLLHILELQNLDAIKMGKLVKALRHVRRERRKCKNYVEVYEPIIEFLNDPNSKKFIKDLERLLGQVRKVETYHKNRQYRTKVNDDSLEIAVQ